MLRLSKYLKPFFWPTIVVITLLLGQALADLALPDYMSRIINEGVVLGDTNAIIQIGGIMLVISLVGALISVAVGFISAKVAAGLGRKLRTDLFDKVSSFSNAEFDNFSTASLITRTTNDVTQIQNLVMVMMRMVFYAPMMAAGGIFYAYRNSADMTWIIALAVVVMLGIIGIMFAIAMPRFKRIQIMVDRLNQVIRENLSGMLVIRAFGTQKFEESRFDDANQDLTKNNLFVNRAMSAMMPAMMLVMNLTTILVVYIGAQQISTFAIDVGQMMAYMQYVMQILMSFLMMSMMFIMIPRASVSASRIADVLEASPSIKDKPNAKDYIPSKGEIVFDNVCFSYPGAEEDVLHNISFVAKPGQTTAFIGSTGSGKSTIVNLLPRFYDVTSGSITIDGLDIKDLSLESLRKSIGYVPQRAILFTGTIESNLKYGDEHANSETLEQGARISQSMEFINSKSEGYQTAISQGGTNVSGGQKQRLSIGRALVKKPQIFVFDDSFSALDFKTDAALRASLKSETGDSTILLVAQRINTIIAADQIVVLESGKIAGIGTHKELLKSCEVYKEIALSQLSEEELTNE